jgi:hypothetical protein
MKKYQQVLIVASSMRDFSEKAKPYMERGFFMVPESLRVSLTSNSWHSEAQSLIAVIFEKPATE